LQCSNFVRTSTQSFVTAAMAAAGCSMQFVLPNRTPLPATREAGLVRIALALIVRNDASTTGVRVAITENYLSIRPHLPWDQVPWESESEHKSQIHQRFGLAHLVSLYRLCR